MAYEPEELAGIEAMHNEGRLMPFIEFPLIGGKFVLRLLREGDKYVMAMPPKEATGYLQGINQACWDAGLHYEAKESAPTDKRNEAMKIYTPPFKHYRGYIHDAEGHMVADDDEVKSAVAQRVRGWGRISYLPNAEAIQDEIGDMMADALNEYYAKRGIKGGA